MRFFFLLPTVAFAAQLKVSGVDSSILLGEGTITTTCAGKNPSVKHVSMPDMTEYLDGQFALAYLANVKPSCGGVDASEPCATSTRSSDSNMHPKYWYCKWLNAKEESKEVIFGPLVCTSPCWHYSSCDIAAFLARFKYLVCEQFLCLTIIRRPHVTSTWRGNW